MIKPKIVYVEWNDAHSSDRWDPIDIAMDTMTDMMHCKTIGYLISRNKDCVVVANTIAWEGGPDQQVVGTYIFQQDV